MCIALDCVGTGGEAATGPDIAGELICVTVSTEEETALLPGAVTASSSSRLQSPVPILPAGLTTVCCVSLPAPLRHPALRSLSE